MIRWSVTDLAQVVAPLLLAPFVGSFLGVLIERLPTGRPVVFARSVCDHCGVVLAPFELVPLVSFLWLRGRCRHCGGRIAVFHLLVELAALGIAAWAVCAEHEAGRIWIDCLLGWTLLAMALIDWRWLLLPDVLTLPLLVAGLLLTLLLQPDAVALHAAAAAAGYIALRAVGWIYQLVRGRPGMGAGDAKLLGAAGAWLGPAALPPVVLLSALLGLAMAGVLHVCGRRMTATTALPFGTCLAAAFWLIWLHQGAIIWPG